MKLMGASGNDLRDPEPPAIDVDRNYHLTIHFFVTTEDFESSPDPTNATILESKNCLQFRVG